MTGVAYEILKQPDPKLTQRSTEVTCFNDEVKQIAADLMESSTPQPYCESCADTQRLKRSAFLREKCILATCFYCKKEKQQAVGVTHTGYGKAVGMSAVQIGKSIRLFIALGQVYVNPVIIAHPKDDEMRSMQESCHSVPLEFRGKQVVFRVKRYRWIKLKWQDLDGVEHQKKFSRFEAEVIQHELDHLDGIMCSDKALPEVKAA